jgi:lipoprotein-releasing system permease protein
VGTLVGFLLGTVVCLNIERIRQFLSWLTATDLFPSELYFLSRLPAEMDVRDTTAVLVMALTLSLLVGASLLAGAARSGRSATL